MDKKEWYFLSADGKTNIHAVEYQPIEGSKIKGIVQIIHGCAESSMLYEDAARDLAWDGFIVRSMDNIGHGLSVSEGQKRNYFGDRGSWKYVLEDVHTLRTLPVSQTEKELPYVLIGHSLGAYLVRDYMLRYDDINAAIISGTGTVPSIGIKTIRMLLNREAKRNGYDSDSDYVDNLMHGTNSRKIKGEKDLYAWLLKDPKMRDVMKNSPVFGGKLTAGIFLELTDAMLRTQKKKNLKKMNKNIPVLFVAGREDPSVSNGKAVGNAVKLYRKIGMKHVSFRLYKNARHCIWQDYSKEDVIEDAVRWINKVIIKKEASIV